MTSQRDGGVRVLYRDRRQVSELPVDRALAGMLLASGNDAINAVAHLGWISRLCYRQILDKSETLEIKHGGLILLNSL